LTRGTQLSLEAVGAGAQTASNTMAVTGSMVKDRALLAAADALEFAGRSVLQSNREDVEDAQAAGTSATLLDRLTLTPSRLAGMASGLRTIAALPDPVGEVLDGWKRPNGLNIRRTRVHATPPAR
jgi:glutamate-5-semialdehyde dehydrogenase